MKVLRIAWKLSGVVLWGFFLALWGRLSILRYRSKWERCRCASRFTSLWARGAARIVGVHVQCHGTPSGAGELVISNHLGYLDILAHACCFPLRFTPKAEIRKWPFFGFLTSANFPIWIDRRHRSKSREYEKEISDTLSNGISMLVYPEGTTTDGKHGLLPFKSTPFQAALDAGCPIRPVLVFYRQEPADAPSAAWFDDTPFASHLMHVLGLKAVHIDVYILEQQHIIPGEERKVLAERMQNCMLREYERILS